VTIEDQVADVFTKLLSRMKFEYFQGQDWRGPSSEGVFSSNMKKG
jgi:hypothetical protein